MKINIKFNPEFVLRDFLASIVVFLVALPLCMGIAMASGVPPALGLISGIIGGLVIGFITGAPLQVSGPAAGLAVMVFDVVSQYGLKSLIPLGFIIGIAQITAAKLKWGGWFRATSPALIKGMLAGIGVLIFSSQFHVMFDAPLQSNGLQNFLAIPTTIQNFFTTLTNGATPLAGLLGLLTLTIIIIWEKSKAKVAKIIPAPLFAIVIASVVVAWFVMPIKLISIPDNIFAVFSVDNIMGSFQNLDAKFFLLAIGMAFVASAETLLCVNAVDKMTKTDSKYDKEMFAQGVGNFIAGIFGALPVTGVIVRSSANVESGAKSKLSAIFHGAWLFLLVMAFPFVLNYIPISGLAAILVFTGWKLLNPPQAIKMYKESKKQFLIYMVTLGTVVSIDLFTGVIAGFALSLFIMALEVLDFHVKFAQSDETHQITISGSISFLNLPKLIKELEKYNPNGDDKSIMVNTENVFYADSAFKEQMDHWISQLRSKGKKIETVGKHAIA